MLYVMGMLKRMMLFALLMLTVQAGKGQALHSLQINEIMTANVDVFVDPSWNFGGFVEIYNPSGSGVQLQGCWFSDDPDNLKKARINASCIVEAYGHQALWFDHHDKFCISQIDLKLDADGGMLYLSTFSGRLITSIQYPPSIARASYARLTDGAEEWGWTSTPTPGETNDIIPPGMKRLPAPEINEDSQIFSKMFRIQVTNIPEGAKLRYTMDGSTPSLTNGLTSTTGAFTVTRNKVYRFAFFMDGWLMSPVVTRSYIVKDKEFDLPVMSVNMENDYLYSAEMGIFVRGVNGRAGLGQSTPCNWNMDWDRPCNFELLDAEGKPLINQEAEMRRCGGWSRGSTPYSFKIHAAKIFEGDNYFHYPIFKNKPFLKHKMLQIRNGGNDTQYRVMDAFLQEIIQTSGMDVDGQAYQPVAHYINGNYYGVINIREPNNKQFIYANYGLEDHEIDLYEVNADSALYQMYGTPEALNRWYALSKNAEDELVYDSICQLADIDEFCNYMACQMWLGNWDWPKNNLKFWRPRTENGRFRFIMYDMDGSLSTTNPFNDFANLQNYTYHNLYDCEIDRITQENWVVTIFLNLLKSEKFRRQFIDTYCLVAGSVFESSRVETIINQLTTRIASMQVLTNGYSKTDSPWIKANSMINTLRSWANSQYSALQNYSPMNLKSVKSRNMKLSATQSEARLFLNDLPVPTSLFDGRIYPPVTLRAEAPAGYRFAGWINRAKAVNSKECLSTDATWTYYDKGSLDGEAWTSVSYSDATWSHGKAPLGYAKDNSPFNTVISYGDDSSNKHSCYYYRTTFNLSEVPTEEETMQLDYMVDDGMVVYVNGQEAYRYNMPSGTISFGSFSSTYAGNTPFEGRVELDAGLFVKGKNVIAVEVHNNNLTSSDSYWMGTLSLESYVEDLSQVSFESTDSVWTLPEGNADVDLVACFEEKEQDSKDYTNLPPVVINEVSAANSVYVNEFFKKNDWVELYNTTSEDIDLNGMYISDDEANPYKCVINGGVDSVSTIIPAYGYKIIWCDKLQPQSQLHTRFKLSNADGERVLLTAADMSWADTLIYCAHEGEESVGRFPDGTSQVYRMTRPTISATNQMNTYTTRWEVPDSLLTGIREVPAMDVLRMGGLGIAYVADELLLKNEEQTDVQLCIYTLSGMLMSKQTYSMVDIHRRVSVASLPAGTYLARVSDKNGNECAVKFRK